MSNIFPQNSHDTNKKTIKTLGASSPTNLTQKQKDILINWENKCKYDIEC